MNCDICGSDIPAPEARYTYSLEDGTELDICSGHGHVEKYDPATINAAYRTYVAQSLDYWEAVDYLTEHIEDQSLLVAALIRL